MPNKPVATDTIHEQQTIGEIPNHLLDYPIKNAAASRPLIGEIAEDFAMSLYTCNVRRLRVNSGRICPDIKLGDDAYAEVKAIGQGGASHLFKTRIEKYHTFMNSKVSPRIEYVYIFHDAKWEQDDTRDSMRHKVIESIYRVLFIDAKKLHQVVLFLPEKKFNIKGRPELDKGYRLTKNIMNVMWALSERSYTQKKYIYTAYRSMNNLPIGLIQ